MASTADCKQFLANFFSKNPEIIIEIFGEDWGDCVTDEESGLTKEKFVSALGNPKKWTRLYRCKPNADSSYCNGLDHVDYYKEDETRIPRPRFFPDKKSHWFEFPVKNIQWERGFCCDPENFDSAICYMVIEDHDGNLHLGEYIGD